MPVFAESAPIWMNSDPPTHPTKPPKPTPSNEIQEIAWEVGMKWVSECVSSWGFGKGGRGEVRGPCADLIVA